MNTVYVNKALQMPVGKLSAQVAHGAMKLLLDRFYIEDNKLVMTDTDAIDWYIQWKAMSFMIDIEYIDFSEWNLSQLKDSGTIAPIIDQGRTLFNGIPTLTVIAQTDEVLVEYDREIEDRSTEKTTEESRQIFLLNRKSDLIENSTLIAKTLASLSIKNLLQHIEEKDGIYFFDLSKNKDLKDWLLGSFAKITLSLKSEVKILNSLEKIKDLSINYISENVRETAFTAIGPCRKSLIEPITKKMQLL